MTDLVRDPYGNPLRRNDEIEHDKSDTITALRAEVASKNEQFQQYARKMEADMNALAAQNERLRATGQAIIDFYNGPLETKRPDIFHRLMVRLNAALEEKP